jgi:TRAP-type C4-dicarboxylate transport system permease small subunit
MPARAVIRTILSSSVEWICLALMAVLSVDLMLGVFSRYVLASTFTWYDEIARACFVWVVFLGAAVGVKRGAHFRLHLLVDRLPPRLSRIAAVVGVLMVITFSGVLIRQGWAFVDLGRLQQTPVMGISKGWIYAAMPVGGALMILYSLPSLWRSVRELRE